MKDLLLQNLFRGSISHGTFSAGDSMTNGASGKTDPCLTLDDFRKGVLKISFEDSLGTSPNA